MDLPHFTQMSSWTYCYAMLSGAETTLARDFVGITISSGDKMADKAIATAFPTLDTRHEAVLPRLREKTP